MFLPLLLLGRGRWFLACVVVAAVYADVPAVGASQGGNI